jgi:hypothetical protein
MFADSNQIVVAVLEIVLTEIQSPSASFTDGYHPCLGPVVQNMPVASPCTLTNYQRLFSASQDTSQRGKTAVRFCLMVISTLYTSDHASKLTSDRLEL